MGRMLVAADMTLGLPRCSVFKPLAVAEFEPEQPKPRVELEFQPSPALLPQCTITVENKLAQPFGAQRLTKVADAPAAPRTEPLVWMSKVPRAVQAPALTLGLASEGLNFAKRIGGPIAASQDITPRIERLETILWSALRSGISRGPVSKLSFDHLYSARSICQFAAGFVN